MKIVFSDNRAHTEKKESSRTDLKEKKRKVTFHDAVAISGASRLFCLYDISRSYLQQ